MSTEPTPDVTGNSHKQKKTSELSEEQLAALRDTEKQRAYEEQYRLQLKRRLCPGCGETDDIPLKAQPDSLVSQLPRLQREGTGRLVTKGADHARS